MRTQFDLWMKDGWKELFGDEPDGKQLDQFYRYYELLIQWNEVMNLTAITEMDQVVTKHFLDSLSLVRAVSELGSRPWSMLDLGTGAGFPGIPLKIAFPELNLVLMDSLNKRVGFLKEVIRELGLEGIEAVHSRAEDGGRNPAYRERFDFCVSRAVANLSTLSEYCLPFVKVGGYLFPTNPEWPEKKQKKPKKLCSCWAAKKKNPSPFVFQVRTWSAPCF